MVVKSKGPRKRTRHLFSRSTKTPITDFLREFKVGEKVIININSSSQKGMPFRRFQGLCGKVVEKRGRAYMLSIKDGDKTKLVLANPEHLRKI